MQKTKIIHKVQFGTGFNALCLAVAGGITVATFSEMYKLGQRIENDKALKQCREAIDILNKVVKNADEASDETEEEK